MKKKISLLYVSPFWPQKSGISEYSECLIWGLDKFFDIVIVTKKKNITNKAIKQHFQVETYGDESDYSQYDQIIYNFGNSPDNHDYMYDMITKYPGYVILHDFTLYYLTIGYYRNKGMLFQKIYQLQGVSGLALVKDKIKERKDYELYNYKELPPLLPLNKEVLNAAKGVFVHSEYTREEVLKVCPECKVCKISIVDCMPKVILDKLDYLRSKYSIPKNELIIGAFGIIAPSKQNEIACKAVLEYNRTHTDKINYVMIGQGEYVDKYLGKHIYKTGFLENNDFFNAMNSCDLIFNLRKPYNGESSATLMQALLLGKRCVVTDVGWFSELPDECVYKVPMEIQVDGLLEKIQKIVASSSLDNKAGKEYVKENSNAATVAKSIFNYLNLSAC